MEQNHTASCEGCAVKSSVLNQHVHPVTAILSKLKTKKLKHTPYIPDWKPSWGEKQAYKVGLYHKDS
jgi:hypothetical protein